MTASASLPDFPACDREPIHIPNAIQPLGCKGESVLGLRLEEAVPDMPCPTLAASRDLGMFWAVLNEPPPREPVSP
jgi:hypothetical protein